MAACKEDSESGMRLQHATCVQLNKILKRNGFNNVEVVETPPLTDMRDKYDLYMIRDGEVLENHKYDVKSTTRDTGKISYTFQDCNGELSVTSSPERNVNNVQLLFVFNSPSTIYMPDMNAWYKLFNSLKQWDGRTFVLKGRAGDTPMFSPKGENLKEKHKIVKFEDDFAGDKVTRFVGKAYIGRRERDIELDYDANRDGWYFNNGSKYVLVSKSDIIDTCSVGKGKIIQ